MTPRERLARLHQSVLDAGGLLGPTHDLGAVEQLKERAKLLRDKTVLEAEAHLLSVAKRLGIEVYFHRPSFRSWADGSFTFPSPVGVSGYGVPSIEVLSGLVYWPSPLLMDSPYQFIHEISHLTVGNQPPTKEKEGWEQAAFELAVIRWLKPRLPKESVQKGFRVIEPISVDKWINWRVLSGPSTEPEILELARQRVDWQFDGPFFSKGGSLRKLKEFQVHPFVKDIHRSIQKWRRDG